MILNRWGQPVNKPRKLMLPIGRINPEAKKRDFSQVKESGETVAMTPLEANQLDDGLFHLRVYRSVTAALVPEKHRA